MQPSVEVHVALVDDDALPPNHDFAFVESGGVLWVAFKRTRVTSPQVLEDAWSVFRQAPP